MKSEQSVHSSLTHLCARIFFFKGSVLAVFCDSDWDGADVWSMSLFPFLEEYHAGVCG